MLRRGLPLFPNTRLNDFLGVSDRAVSSSTECDGWFPCRWGPILCTQDRGSPVFGQYNCKKTFISKDRVMEGPRAQQAGPNDDKHKSARNFLHVTLPFLARVLLQDAPRWIASYPNWFFSRIFQTKMTPAYNLWATRLAEREEHVLGA
jgi:hypothetical protein